MIARLVIIGLLSTAFHCEAADRVRPGSIATDKKVARSVVLYCNDEYINCDVSLKPRPLVLEVKAAPGPIDNREENMAWLRALNVNVNIDGSGSGKSPAGK